MQLEREKKEESFRLERKKGNRQEQKLSKNMKKLWYIRVCVLRLFNLYFKHVLFLLYPLYLIKLNK